MQRHPVPRAAGSHGGNLRALARESGLPPRRILDFSANINPLGPVPSLPRIIGEHFDDILHYPDPQNIALVGAIRKRFGWPLERIVAGNGASELLHVLCRVSGCRRAVIPAPSYADYAIAASLAGMRVLQPRMKENEGFAVPWNHMERVLQNDDLVILGNPNNPTGRIIENNTLRKFIKGHPHVRFIVDESFLEFASPAGSLADHLPPNAVMMRSMTKFYAIPGLRLGFAVARSRLASALRKNLPPWSVNCMASRAGIVSLANASYADRTRAAVTRFRRDLVAKLRRLAALKICESDANFILVRINAPSCDAYALRDRLLKRGIAIRVCANFESLNARFFRVAVRAFAENDRLVEALRQVLKG